MWSRWAGRLKIGDADQPKLVLAALRQRGQLLGRRGIGRAGHRIGGIDRASRCRAPTPSDSRRPRRCRPSRLPASGVRWRPAQRPMTSAAASARHHGSHARILAAVRDFRQRRLRSLRPVLAACAWRARRGAGRSAERQRRAHDLERTQVTLTFARPTARSCSTSPTIRTGCCCGSNRLPAARCPPGMTPTRATRGCASWLRSSSIASCCSSTATRSGPQPPSICRRGAADRDDALPPLATFRLRGRMPGRRAQPALAVRPGDRSLSADDSPRRRRNRGPSGSRDRTGAGRSISPGSSGRRRAWKCCTRLPGARLHAHPAEGARSHPVRARPVPAQRARCGRS